MKVITKPTRIEAAGTPTKIIEEFFGRVNSSESAISIARMNSPKGWSEPGQTPEFDEYTVVLEGALTVETESNVRVVPAGQAIYIPKGTWVRYSTPNTDAMYIAVCLPAFSPDTVNRDSA